jgi:hypothetical protein
VPGKEGETIEGQTQVDLFGRMEVRMCMANPKKGEVVFLLRKARHQIPVLSNPSHRKMDGQSHRTLANRDNGLEGRMTPERRRGMR